ncbi:MAG: FAD-dependent oxidoreductase [Acidobacteria bacterium]|nr:FAD-dependent oxidoreductase [Acidobacteriota bacterium]
MVSALNEVLIIGGGLAGLSAGVALAGAGRRVRVLEQSPHLGGRARSFLHAPTGDIVDNGQHLLMGSYHSTLRFLTEIGTRDRIALQPSLRIHFVEPPGTLSTLECPPLASPWHLLAGVLRSDAFSWSEKLEISRLGRAVRQGYECTDLTVEEWLTKLGQSERVKRGFWDLISIAALNENPRRASAAVFARVLKLALFTSASDSCLALPRVGLGDCYTDAARSYIKARDGETVLGGRVESLMVRDGSCEGVRFADGSSSQAGTIISAVPWHEFVRMLPAELLRAAQYFMNILSLRPAPIISISIWMDRAITELDFAGLRGTTVQWIFNRGRILGSGRHHYSLVLSGAHEHIGRSKEELLQIALSDLARLFPAARDSKVIHSLVIKERFATFSPAVGVDAVRPAAKSPIRGLFLAGDWTATGLPATIEGAVQSGYTAAEHVLHQC